ncbi:hypothetical protein BC937DRAFT_93561, partial [Endogone sp. FLAS-F59071]
FHELENIYLARFPGLGPFYFSSFFFSCFLPLCFLFFFFFFSWLYPPFKVQFVSSILKKTHITQAFSNSPAKTLTTHNFLSFLDKQNKNTLSPQQNQTHSGPKSLPMANGRNRLYFSIVLCVSTLPLFSSVYAFTRDQTALGIVLSAIFVAFLGAALVLFLSYKMFRVVMPFVIRSLSSTSSVLHPLADYLSHSRIIGPAVSAVIRVWFFFWFAILLLCDWLVRLFLGRLVGTHPTGETYSLINAMNTNLDLFDDSIRRTDVLEDADRFEAAKKMEERQREEEDRPLDQENKEMVNLLKRPRYSLSLAYTTAVASKLVYEDVTVIKYELERAGFDVKNTFRPIAYKNVCAFIAEKDDDIILVFRGTNPFNIQNYVTNINVTMTPVKSPHIGPMGSLHKGFYEALGDPLSLDEESPVSPTPGRVINIELSSTSLWRTLKSAVGGLATLGHFFVVNLFHHVSDPVDHRFLGDHADVWSESAYVQAEKWIIHLVERDHDKGEREEELAETESGYNSHDAEEGGHGEPRNRKNRTTRPLLNTSGDGRKKKLYITGHSLGGGLATIFLGKMLQSKSPLLDIFEGLYTYGQPKIGDNEFAKVFGPNLSSKMFHHALNNDIITRVPNWNHYGTPPGTLVFIDSSRNITLYPPNPYTNVPVPVRPISFLHLSGLLNSGVIARMGRESWLRILLRIIFPFFINDHFPGDYSESLREGKVEWVVLVNDEEVVGGEIVGRLEGGEKAPPVKPRSAKPSSDSPKGSLARSPNAMRLEVKVGSGTVAA